MPSPSNSPSLSVINIGTFITGNQTEKEQIAHELVNAFKSVGFVYLSHHGIQTDLVFDQVKPVKLISKWQ